MGIIQGSKDPNNRALGPNYYSIDGIRALNPYYLGPWTLRDGETPKILSALNPKLIFIVASAETETLALRSQILSHKPTRPEHSARRFWGISNTYIGLKLIYKLYLLWGNPQQQCCNNPENS